MTQFNQNDDDWIDELQAITFDVGSSVCKLGFSGDDAPRAVFPSLVGRPKHPGIMVGMDAKDAFVGDEAHSKRGILNVERPVLQGLPRNWFDYEKLLHHCPYNELCITPEEHPIIVSQPPYLPNNKRKLITEFFFELFNVPYFYLEVDSVLACLASGTESGVVLDIGYDYSRVSAVYERSLVEQSVFYEGNLGMKDFHERFDPAFEKRQTEEANSLMSQLGVYKENLIRGSKSQVCVPLDYEKEIASFQPSVFEYSYRDYSRYPSRDKIVKFHVGEEALLPEIFFSPAKFGINCRDVAHMIHCSLLSLPKDLREKLQKSIVACGGLTSCLGFKDRLQNELKKINSEYSLVKYFDGSSYYSVWIGGSILSSFSKFRDFWISKDVYDDCGSDIHRRKCPNGLTKVPRDAIVWSRERHSSFAKGDQTMAIFLIWCIFQEESNVYCIPVEVLFIILEYFVAQERFIVEDFPEDEPFEKYLEKYRRNYL